MDAISTGITIGVGTGVILAILGWAWLKLSPDGQRFWTSLGTAEVNEPGVGPLAPAVVPRTIAVEGIRALFVLAGVAFIFAFGVLLAFIFRNPLTLHQHAEQNDIADGVSSGEVFAPCDYNEIPIAGECLAQGSGGLINAGIQLNRPNSPNIGSNGYHCFYVSSKLQRLHITAYAYCASKSQAQIIPIGQKP